MRALLYRSFVLLACLLVGSAFSQSKKDSIFDHHIGRVSQLIDNYELDKALTLADSIEKALKETGSKKRLSDIYNSIGTIYREKSMPREAIYYFGLSLDLNEKIGNTGGLAANYVNLGSMYSFLDENKTALNYYFKAVNLSNKTKQEHNAAILYNNIGNIYIDDKNFASAIYYFNKAFKLSYQAQDSMNMAMVCHNLGNCARAQYGVDSAIAYYKRSLGYLSRYGEGLGHIFNYNQLSSMLIKKNKLDEAERYALKSIEINKRGAESLDDMGNSYALLADIYEKKGNIKKAFEYQKLLLSAKDSLKKISGREELIKVGYESELKSQKKEQELIRRNQEAINTAKLESKNKNLIFSYAALGFAVIMGLLILNGYRQKRNANLIISKQKDEVEIKNAEILSSINYAKRIQYALLAHKEFLEHNLPEHFVLFDPKDIVSGDFYWATKHNNKLYLAVCDSTGHGVPGAFMSLLNIGYLSEAINEKNIEEPNLILNHVRLRLIASISKEGQQDGFDGILLCIDRTTRKITYSAANNAPILVSKGQIHELEKDKMPVGLGEKMDNFNLHTIEASKGDVLYLYTDGYADQFGGPKGKKFKYKQLNELLLQLSSKNMSEQLAELKETFDAWKGNLEQVDDVCVIGIKF